MRRIFSGALVLVAACCRWQAQAAGPDPAVVKATAAGDMRAWQARALAAMEVLAKRPNADERNMACKQALQLIDSLVRLRDKEGLVRLAAAFKVDHQSQLAGPMIVAFGRIGAWEEERKISAGLVDTIAKRTEGEVVDDFGIVTALARTGDWGMAEKITGMQPERTWDRTAAAFAHEAARQQDKPRTLKYAAMAAKEAQAARAAGTAGALGPKEAVWDRLMFLAMSADFSTVSAEVNKLDEHERGMGWWSAGRGYALANDRDNFKAVIEEAAKVSPAFAMNLEAAGGDTEAAKKRWEKLKQDSDTVTPKTKDRRQMAEALLRIGEKEAAGQYLPYSAETPEVEDSTRLCFAWGEETKGEAILNSEQILRRTGFNEFALATRWQGVEHLACRGDLKTAIAFRKKFDPNNRFAQDAIRILARACLERGDLALAAQAITGQGQDPDQQYIAWLLILSKKFDEAETQYAALATPESQAYFATGVLAAQPAKLKPRPTGWEF